MDKLNYRSWEVLSPEELAHPKIVGNDGVERDPAMATSRVNLVHPTQWARPFPNTGRDLRIGMRIIVTALLSIPSVQPLG